LAQNLNALKLISFSIGWQLCEGIENDMKTRTMEAAIGITLFIASLILVIGLVWLSEQTVGWRNYELIVAFETAEGLKRGDPVNLIGIKIGRVDEVKYANGRAEAHIFLNADYKLPRGSQFFLESSGLIAGKAINVVPGDGNDYLVEGEVVEGEVGEGLEELGTAVASLQERLNTAVDTLLSHDNLTRIRLTLRNVQSTSSLLEIILAQNQKNIDLTMDNLRSSSDGLRTLFTHNHSQIDSAVVNLTAASIRLGAASRDLQTTTTGLKAMSKAIEDRQGTLGALVYERGLYDSLTTATQNLNALIETSRNIRRSM
jgi:phospholipid/cholesterol/gamma-HCH transport system substrate-binding protein